MYKYMTKILFRLCCYKVSWLSLLSFLRIRQALVDLDLSASRRVSQPKLQDDIHTSASPSPSITNHPSDHPNTSNYQTPALFQQYTLPRSIMNANGPSLHLQAVVRSAVVSREWRARERLINNFTPLPNS